MTVALILAQKGREVHTASTRHSLQDVAAELVRRGVGALVVLDDAEDVVGVIGERDIVSAVAQHGCDALSHEVARHLAASFSYVCERDTVDHAALIMTNARARHLPVLREGRLVGVVSIGDVVKRRIEQIDAERKALHDYITSA
ncbi:MAG TPA: CBS domain-containing protein [Methylocystis sp.]|nr:CBS domain-containing protein [Methylocystis sp.]